MIIKKAITINETTCNNSHVFFIPMKILGHIIWHVVDKHEKKLCGETCVWGEGSILYVFGFGDLLMLGVHCSPSL